MFTKYRAVRGLQKKILFAWPKQSIFIEVGVEGWGRVEEEVVLTEVVLLRGNKSYNMSLWNLQIKVYIL